ncbi:hypothetical protein [Aeromonas phage AerS_266]|nr:hypothetical protein [Aeromonas phage AerS_266]
MKTIKHYIELLLSFLLLVSAGVNATSADGPELNYQLQPAVKWEVVTSLSPTQHHGIGIRGTNELGEEQTFKLFCRKGNPMLVATYDAKDVKGEYSDWGTDIAIQWYPETANKARDLFMDAQDDLMVPGLAGTNLRETMIEVKRRGENGGFAFIVYNVGMQGQITTNVVSFVYPVGAAKALSEAIMKQDYGMACDTATGGEQMSTQISQKHKH